MKRLISLLLCLSILCTVPTCWAYASSDQSAAVVDAMVGQYKRVALEADGMSGTGIVSFMNALGAEVILTLNPDSTGVIDHSSAGLLAGDDEKFTWTADNKIHIYGEDGTWWYEGNKLYFETPSSYEEYERIESPDDGTAQAQANIPSSEDSFFDEQPLNLDMPDVSDGCRTIAAGTNHTVGLHSDGTVVAAGDNSSAQCNTSFWKDIIAVSACGFQTVGLRSDGTVVVAGGRSGQFDDASGWTDIVAVAAGKHHILGLKSDGTVVADGDNFPFGQCKVDSWTDIVAIAGGRDHSVGLRSDGTVVAVGYTWSGLCDVDDWTDIVAVDANEEHTVGLCSNGMVVAVGSNKDGKCDVNNWRGIVAIAAGGDHTVGLRSDGTVVATGSNENGQCNVSSWSDIVAIAAGDEHTVGLRSDGTVVATGDNEDSQCNVSGWTGIKQPNT